MANDLPEDLVRLQRDSWAAQQKLHAYPKPRSEGWTAEHDVSWPADWQAFRVAAEAFHEALRNQGGQELEQAVKKRVRHDEAA